jgi:hypothetical protein
MVGIGHNENDWSLNLQKKRTLHLLHNFGHGVYDNDKRIHGNLTNF